MSTLSLANLGMYMQNLTQPQSLVPTLGSSVAGLKRKHDEAMLFIEADFNKTVKSKRLKKDASAVLFGWLFDHILNPYPTLADKQVLAKESKLSMLQVRNWLTNQRKRLK